MLRRDERIRTKNSIESRKTSKTPDPPKQTQINNSDKTQGHKPRSETVDLADEDMDTDDSNKPLTTNDIITTIESRIGLDKDSAESLKPRKQVLDDILE